MKDARVFVRGSVNHEGHHSHEIGVGDCKIEPGGGILNALHGGGSHSHIFDHTVTKDYQDTYNGPGAGYQFLIDSANRPSPRCATCTEGDDEWGQLLDGDHSDTQHLGSYVRDLAIALIRNHDFENADSPLALFLSWSGPHSPHTPEGLVTAAQVENAHCAQEVEDGNQCTGDQYFSQNRYAARQFKDSGHTARTGCHITQQDYYHSAYQAMQAEISLYMGKIRDELVASVDSTGVSAWSSTLFIYQTDNGGIPSYNYPMRG